MRSNECLVDWWRDHLSYLVLSDKLENLEMSENLTVVREMSGSWQKSGNCQGNVGKFDSCQESWPKLGELSGMKSCQGKLFIVNLTFAATPVFSRMHSMHYVGNHNMKKSAVNSQGNVGEFQAQCLEYGHLFTHADGSRVSIALIYLSVILSVCPDDTKRLKLKSPNLAYRDSPSRYLAHQINIRTKGQRVKKCKKSRDETAVRRHVAAMWRSSTKRPAWVMHSIECSASGFSMCSCVCDNRSDRVHRPTLVRRGSDHCGQRRTAGDQAAVAVPLPSRSRRPQLSLQRLVSNRLHQSSILLVSTTEWNTRKKENKNLSITLWAVLRYFGLSVNWYAIVFVTTDKFEVYYAGW